GRSGGVNCIDGGFARKAQRRTVDRLLETHRRPRVDCFANHNLRTTGAWVRDVSYELPQFTSGSTRIPDVRTSHIADCLAGCAIRRSLQESSVLANPASRSKSDGNRGSDYDGITSQRR